MKRAVKNLIWNESYITKQENQLKKTPRKQVYAVTKKLLKA
jgi:hypothetical protein